MGAQGISYTLGKPLDIWLISRVVPQLRGIPRLICIWRKNGILCAFQAQNRQYVKMMLFVMCINNDLANLQHFYPSVCYNNLMLIYLLGFFFTSFSRESRLAAEPLRLSYSCLSCIINPREELSLLSELVS